MLVSSSQPLPLRPRPFMMINHSDVDVNAQRHAQRQPVARVDVSRVVAIIPALNESKSLPLVLADLPPLGQVIVVDNGSTDGTAEVARNHGASVILEPRRGYGSACLAGINHARKTRESTDVVVFVDADYSDHPELLPDLVRPILAGDCDFVLSSRLLGPRERGAMPPQSVYGNKLACWLMKLLFGARYTDLGPFRAISWPALEKLHMQDTNFGWTIEMQIKAAVRNVEYQEIPMPYRCRIGTSKISGTISGTVRAGTKILYTVAKYGLLQRAP